MICWVHKVLRCACPKCEEADFYCEHCCRCLQCGIIDVKLEILKQDKRIQDERWSGPIMGFRALAETAKAMRDFLTDFSTQRSIALAIPPDILRRPEKTCSAQEFTVHSPHGESETYLQRPEKGYIAHKVQGTLRFDEGEEKEGRGPEEAQREQGSEGQPHH